MADPTLIAIQDDNQSTLTIDTSSNPVSAGPVTSGDEQYANYNETRGWDITANINSMTSVERTQCQFGYWNNDEFSFNDSTGMIYFMVNLQAASPNLYLSTILCCKLPKMPWSTFGLENTTGGGQWQELTPGEAARNAQQSLAKVICYYMNNHAVEVYQAPVSVPGTNWKQAGYVDALGGTAVYLTRFSASNLTFVPGGTNTQVITQNFIEASVAAGWTAQVYFMDGPFSIYNTRGGAFSSGMGTYVGSNIVKQYTTGALPPVGSGFIGATTTVSSPFPYLFNWSGSASPFTKPAIGYFPVRTDVQTVYSYLGIPYTPSMNSTQMVQKMAQLAAFFGPGTSIPFERATTLLNSKYYIASSDDLYYGSTLAHTSNGKMPSQVMGVLEATADGRNVWGEYSAQAIAPVQQTSSSVQVINYDFQNDQAEPLVCMSNVAFPLAPPTIPAFVQGDLAHLPDFEWVSMYFESTDKAGTFPIIPSPARLASETHVAAFQTARRPG